MVFLDKHNLHEYQKAAVAHILSTPKCGLFLDMGLGKTVSTLTAIEELMNTELEIDTALIVAPKRVAETVWHKEIAKWRHLQSLSYSIISGSAAQRKKALAKKARVYIISRDNIAWLCGLHGSRKLPFDMLVIDESSSFKNPKSQRFRALRRVASNFERIVLLTGTPAPNGLIDLWSQIYLIDQGERLGKTLTSYREKYFKPDKRNGAIIYSYKPLNSSEQAIFSKIENVCMSMEIEDWLDMPERKVNNITVEFSDELMERYESFERDQVLSLVDETGGISAVNAAALSNKLLQFANGAIYDEHRNVHELHRLKIEALQEIIEQAQGKPVLVAWAYRHDMYRILESLKKYKPVQLESEKDIDAWNRGKIQVLLMHPASGGHGLNLQHGGNIVVWFGQTWSLELYQQLNARLYRQGQKQSYVAINHLIAARTIDQDVAAALARKDHKQEALMEAVKTRIKKYLK